MGGNPGNFIIKLGYFLALSIKEWIDLLGCIELLLDLIRACEPLGDKFLLYTSPLFL